MGGTGDRTPFNPLRLVLQMAKSQGSQERSEVLGKAAVAQMLCDAGLVEQSKAAPNLVKAEHFYKQASNHTVCPFSDSRSRMTEWRGDLVQSVKAYHAPSKHLFQSVKSLGTDSVWCRPSKATLTTRPRCFGEIFRLALGIQSEHVWMMQLRHYAHQVGESAGGDADARSMCDAGWAGATSGS